MAKLCLWLSECGCIKMHRVKVLGSLRLTSVRVLPSYLIPLILEYYNNISIDILIFSLRVAGLSVDSLMYGGSQRSCMPLGFHLKNV